MDRLNNMTDAFFKYVKANIGITKIFFSIFNRSNFGLKEYVSRKTEAKESCRELKMSNCKRAKVSKSDQCRVISVISYQLKLFDIFENALKWRNKHHDKTGRDKTRYDNTRNKTRRIIIFNYFIYIRLLTAALNLVNKNLPISL